MSPSDPQYLRVAELQERLTFLVNAHMHRITLDEATRLAAIEATRDELANELQASAFRHYIEELTID